MKKINCRHGLGPKEEIQARRLKDKILQEDKTVIEERINPLYKSFSVKINGSFYEYVKKNDIVLYSAFERAGGIIKMYYFMGKLGLH